MLNINKDSMTPDLIIERNHLILKTWELWNASDNISPNKIAKILNLGNSTVRRYLKIGHDTRKCTYNPRDKYRFTSKKVVKLDMNNNYISSYSSIKDASRANNIKTFSLVAHCCRGITRKAKGYRWMFKEDYDRYINEKIELPSMSNKPINSIEVVQLDENMQFVKAFDSMILATKHNNLKNSTAISKCCKGDRKTAGGYKWMYKKDYEQYIEEQNKAI